MKYIEKYKIIIFTILISLFPFITNASSGKTFKSMVESFVSSIKEPLISLMTSAAVTTFAWGVVKYVKGGEVDKESAKELMVWGIIGITVIAAVWGFVNAMKSTLGLS